MTDVRFGGLVIGTRDPEGLSGWYLKALGTDGGDILGRPVVEVGGARLVFDRRDDVAPATAEPGRSQINLFTTDLDPLVAHLESLGVTWIRPMEVLPGFGGIGTFADPDGNYVQILAPAR